MINHNLLLKVIVIIRKEGQRTRLPVQSTVPPGTSAGLTSVFEWEQVEPRHYGRPRAERKRRHLKRLSL